MEESNLPLQPDTVPAPTYEDLAGIVEHLLLRPELTETDIAQGCDLAKQYKVGAVIVRPSDVDLAARWFGGSSVVLGTVVDFPHGYSSTSVKTYAVRDMLRRGVKEIDTVINTSKLVSRQFQYVEAELMQMADACHQSGAILKVILEDQFLDHELKILCCRICRRAGADFISSASMEDLPLLKEYGKERLKFKLSSPVSTLESALQVRDAGWVRIHTESTAVLLDAWKAKLIEDAKPAVVS